jgi:hypothetical protein
LFGVFIVASFDIGVADFGSFSSGHRNPSTPLLYLRRCPHFPMQTKLRAKFQI